jgi:hypothetical protein
VVQAIDRARFIHRAADKPCRVFVLTNVVLPLTVHGFATWDELIPNRIASAWVTSGGVLPLGAKWLVEQMPDVFGSPRTAERELARWTAEQNRQTPMGIFIGKWRFWFPTASHRGQAKPSPDQLFPGSSSTSAGEAAWQSGVWLQSRA